MVTVDFLLNPEWNVVDPDMHLRHADNVWLHYHAFCGDQILIVNQTDFSARWGWIPLLDFAAAFMAIAEKLSNGASEEQFEFTESEAVLHFKAVDHKVLISASYVSGVAACVVSELSEAAEQHAQRLVKTAISMYPGLAQVPEFKAMWPVSIRETFDPGVAS